MGMAKKRLEQGLEEAAAAGYLTYGRMSLEVLYLLPETFVRAYSELFHEALKEDSAGAMGSAQKRAEVGRADGSGGKKGSMSSAKVPKGKDVEGIFTVRSEKAFREKKRVDARLRQIAREIGTEEENGKEVKQRCSGRDDRGQPGCGRWIENDWSFCGWCGRRVGTGS